MIIDTHHHWMPQIHYDNLEKYMGNGYSVERKQGKAFVFHQDVQFFMPTETYFLLEQQLADMDEAGVDYAVLHAGLWQDWNHSLDIAREINDEIAKVQHAYPDRFIGLAHVPMSGEENAILELERAVHDLGLKGLAFNTHVNGIPLDDRRFWPIYEKVSELNVPVVVHPSSVPPNNDLLLEYNLSNGLGRALDLTTVCIRLLYSGVLRKNPGLKFCLAHLGGAFFALKNRVDPNFFAKELPAPGSVPHLANVDFSEQINQIFVDTAPSLWDTPEIQCAIELLGAEQVVFGSDYPIRQRWMSDGVTTINALKVEKELREKILWKNAAALFGIE